MFLRLNCSKHTERSYGTPLYGSRLLDTALTIKATPWGELSSGSAAASASRLQKSCPMLQTTAVLQYIVIFNHLFGPPQLSFNYHKYYSNMLYLDMVRLPYQHITQHIEKIPRSCIPLEMQTPQLLTQPLGPGTRKMTPLQVPKPNQDFYIVEPSLS